MDICVFLFDADELHRVTIALRGGGHINGTLTSEDLVPEDEVQVLRTLNENPQVRLWVHVDGKPSDEWRVVTFDDVQSIEVGPRRLTARGVV